jgi:beta-glucanase (GH16 family)
MVKEGQIPLRLALLAVLVLLLAGCGSGLSSQVLPTPPQWTLVWSDEFDAPDGSAPDSTKWTPDIGGGGWGNDELESYTSRPQNTFIQGGNLVIQALRETYTGPDGITRDYTSARLKTQKLFTQTYGRFEARVKIPYGQGLWPAFWMLGSNINTVGFPACGEIDIFENIGREPSIVHGTIHGPGYVSLSSLSAAYTLPGGQKFSDDFHVFAVEWTPSLIRFYVDEVLYETLTPASLPAGTAWVFDQPFFMILNVAVGGDWPGSPNSATVFPQTMLVDYVRVYKQAG